MIYVDTHVLIWMYSGKLELFTKKGLDLLEKHELLYSPICRLELQYLYETKKISEKAETLLTALEEEVAIAQCSLPFETVIHGALLQNWTRDPFDRIITAHAKVNQCILLTKDRTIHKNFAKAQW